MSQTFLVEVAVWVEADDEDEARRIIAEKLAERDTSSFDILGVSVDNG